MKNYYLERKYAAAHILMSRELNSQKTDLEKALSLARMINNNSVVVGCAYKCLNAGKLTPEIEILMPVEDEGQAFRQLTLAMVIRPIFYIEHAYPIPSIYKDSDRLMKCVRYEPVEIPDSKSLGIALVPYFVYGQTFFSTPIKLSIVVKDELELFMHEKNNDSGLSKINYLVKKDPVIYDVATHFA